MIINYSWKIFIAKRKYDAENDFWMMSVEMEDF